MTFQGRPFDDIRPEDILALQENEVPEGKTLDYKLSLPGNTDAEKKEFLADVSSFANAAGGYIVSGVAESEGIAADISGLRSINADSEKLRLDSIIRDGLAPRVPGLRIRDILVSEDTRVLLMHIPRSWAQPHMVTFKNSSRFYARNSAGKYPLDVAEIRSAFLLSEGLADRLRSFRLERIGNVVAQQTPLILPESANVVFHSIPFSALDAGPTNYLDYSRLGLNSAILGLRKVSGQVNDYHPNFDGIVAYREADKTGGYVQIFRTGALEAVDVNSLQKSYVSELLREAAFIPCVRFEQNLIATAEVALQFQQSLGLEPPFALMVSLVRVSGYSMPLPGQFLGEHEMGHPIDRDVLIVPEVVVEAFPADVPRSMRPIFDAISNAAGHAGSVNYDHEGRWSPST